MEMDMRERALMLAWQAHGAGTVVIGDLDALFEVARKFEAYLTSADVTYRDAGPVVIDA